MQDRPGPFTLRERAAVLGISLNTLRRRMAADQVKAARIERAPGFVWQVYLGGAAPSNDRATERVRRGHASAAQQPPTSIMPAEAMAAYSDSLMVPLLQALGQCEERARELLREAGRLRTEQDAVDGRIAHLEFELSPLGESDAAAGDSEISAAADSLPGPHEPTAKGHVHEAWWQRWRWWMVGFAL
jgi:hypothetical protein